MQYNLIKEDGAKLLLDGLLKNNGLRVLDVSFNKFGHNEYVTNKLAELIKTNKKLVHVDFSYNHFSAEEA